MSTRFFAYTELTGEQRQNIISAVASGDIEIVQQNLPEKIEIGTNMGGGFYWNQLLYKNAIKNGCIIYDEYDQRYTYKQFCEKVGEQC
jgi:hypothetical protein